MCLIHKAKKSPYGDVLDAFLHEVPDVIVVQRIIGDPCSCPPSAERIRIRVGSLKALNVSARALTIRSSGMAVLAARTLAVSMQASFSAVAAPRFTAGEPNECPPFIEMVAHL